MTTTTSRIPTEMFSGWMGTIGDRFGRALEPATMKGYHRILSNALTEEQFDRAAAIVFARFEYKGSWPSPQVFIDAGRPRSQPELDAAETLRVIRLLIRANGYAIEARPSYFHLEPHIRRAVDAVGGIKRVHESTLESEPFLLRDFAKALGQAKEAHTAAVLAGVAPQQLDPSVRAAIDTVSQRMQIPATTGARDAKA